MDYKTCLNFAKLKHQGQYRKHGPAYISHPLRVVEILRKKDINDQDTLVAGLFHDLLEDTNATREDILYYSNSRVLEIVELLTKKPGYKMDEYICNISKCPVASLVKLADRLSNLEDILFLTDFDFLKTYYEESFKYFLGLSRSSIFEKDLLVALDKLKIYMENLRIY